MSINAVNSNGKVTAGHLKKTAYLYIRQSTLRQVFENTESTQRQYALRQRAVVLGWPAERIEIIDCDQGQSGASTGEREGFQKLVAEVGLGKAGILSWDWKSRAWPATVPIGTGCWRFVP
jgi:DNA invertase Pin-like site-specific DNA recombinase